MIVDPSDNVVIACTSRSKCDVTVGRAWPVGCVPKKASSQPERAAAYFELLSVTVTAAFCQNTLMANSLISSSSSFWNNRHLQRKENSLVRFALSHITARASFATLDGAHSFLLLLLYDNSPERRTSRTRDSHSPSERRRTRRSISSSCTNRLAESVGSSTRSLALHLSVAS